MHESNNKKTKGGNIGTKGSKRYSEKGKSKKKKKKALLGNIGTKGRDAAYDLRSSADKTFPYHFFEPGRQESNGSYMY